MYLYWYCVTHNAYKIYDPITHKVFASRDVIFHEYVEEVKKEDDPPPYFSFEVTLDHYNLDDHTLGSIVLL